MVDVMIGNALCLLHIVSRKRRRCTIAESVEDGLHEGYIGSPR
jgi:hypothetical protein